MEETDFEMLKELSKNEMDKKVCEEELLREKIEAISKMDNKWFDEITKGEDYNKPIKMKKPFKLKWVEFWTKLGKIMG